MQPSGQNGGSAPAPAPRRSLFAEAGADAERPVDLSGVLEGRGGGPLLRGALERVEAWGREGEGRAERELAAEVSARLQSGSLQLPPMPQIALRVSRSIDAPDCRSADLAALLELDAALATRLVGIANSPFYAGLGSVGSVGDAVVRLGLSETRNVVMAIVLRGKVFRVPGHESAVQSLWRHSLAASLCAQSLAAGTGVDPDVGHLAGLLHDVGRVVLLALVGEIQGQTRGRVRPGLGSLEALGEATYAPLGALVAESWRVSPEIVAALLHQQVPGDAPDPVRPLVRVLRVADAFAERIALAPGAAAPDPEPALALARELGLAPEVALEIEAEAVAAFEARAKAI